MAAVGTTYAAADGNPTVASAAASGSCSVGGSQFHLDAVAANSGLGADDNSDFANKRMKRWLDPCGPEAQPIQNGLTYGPRYLDTNWDNTSEAQSMYQGPQMQQALILNQPVYERAHESSQRSVVMGQAFKKGICVNRLRQYMKDQRCRQDDSMEFWTGFVNEHYAPQAKMRLCLSSHNYTGKSPINLFFEAKETDALPCGFCGSKLGRVFEGSFDILPRLNQIKFADGAINEILYLDNPYECQLPSGIILLEHLNATQDTIYDEVRVSHTGRLRVSFTQEMKILKWEFCIQKHEELLNSRSITPQVNKLMHVAKKCEAAGSSGVSYQDLAAICNMFMAASGQLSRQLEQLSLNEFGFSRRYMRYLQLSQIVNSMKDLMSFSYEIKRGPKDCLKYYSHRVALNLPPQSIQDQQQMADHGLHVVDPRNPNTTTSIQPLMNNGHIFNNNPMERLNRCPNLPRNSGIPNQLHNNINTCHQNSAVPSSNSNDAGSDANRSRVLQQMIQQLRKNPVILNQIGKPAYGNKDCAGFDEFRTQTSNVAGSSSSPSMNNTFPSFQRNIPHNSMHLLRFDTNGEPVYGNGAMVTGEQR